MPVTKTGSDLITARDAAFADEKTFSQVDHSDLAEDGYGLFILSIRDGGIYEYNPITELWELIETPYTPANSGDWS